MPRDEEDDQIAGRVPPEDAVERTSGSGTDVFEDGYLTELRKDWPE